MPPAASVSGRDYRSRARDGRDDQLGRVVNSNPCADPARALDNYAGRRIRQIDVPRGDVQRLGGRRGPDADVHAGRGPIHAIDAAQDELVLG